MLTPLLANIHKHVLSSSLVQCIRAPLNQSHDANSPAQCACVRVRLEAVELMRRRVVEHGSQVLPDAHAAEEGLVEYDVLVAGQIRHVLCSNNDVMSH